MSRHVDEQARRVSIQHAIADAAEEIAGEYQLLTTGERLERLDGLLDEISHALEGEDIDPALTELGAEVHAWLIGRQAEAAQ